MALYFLDYDLREEKDYKKLYDELESFNAVKVLDSLWCFKRLNTNPKGLRDYFKDFLDKDDGLSVSEVSDWATLRAEKTPNDLS